MNQYNFDEIIDRQGTNALNTDGFRQYIFHAGPEKQFPYKDDEFVRMWVADMEFAVAPEIRKALQERLDRRIYGYTGTYDGAYVKAFAKWCKDHYNWTFDEAELCFSPGVIPALYLVAEILCGEGDKILINTPAYGYFLHTAEYVHRDVLMSPLKKDAEGRFSLDLEDFEAKCADPSCKLVIWCNPHNPTGRVWTEEELKAAAAVVEKYDKWIISDEIHCDLLRMDQHHTPMAKVMKEYKKLITCMAPTKTFNLAGLSFSNVIIRDPWLRKEYKARDKVGGLINAFSLTAATAAYQKGEPWRQELRAYLDENFAFTKRFLEEQLPEAVMQPAEATYLAWVDMSKCLPDVEDLPAFFANEAGVLLEGGNSLFVGNAEGYVRLNLAMPRSIIRTGLERMRDAIRAHRAD